MEITFAAQKRKKISNQGLVETEILHKRERERERERDSGFHLISIFQYLDCIRKTTSSINKIFPECFKNLLTGF